MQPLGVQPRKLCKGKNWAANWPSILEERSVNCYGMENEVHVGVSGEEADVKRVDDEKDGS